MENIQNPESAKSIAETNFEMGLIINTDVSLLGVFTDILQIFTVCQQVEN